MKNLRIGMKTLATLAAALLFCGGHPLASSHFTSLPTSTSTPTLQNTQNQQSQTQPGQTQTQKYTGKLVMANDGTYELKSGTDTYKLANLDQTQDSQLVNQKVVVRGTLDPQTGQINVTQIKAAPTQPQQ